MHRRQKERKLQFREFISSEFPNSSFSATAKSPIKNWDQVDLDGKRVFVFHRVSERNQKNNMKSTADHLAKMAKERGIIVAKIYAFQESAKVRDRPRFEKMLKDARNENVRFILAVSSGRFKRSSGFHLINNPGEKPSDDEWNEFMKMMDDISPICVTESDMSNRGN